MTNIQELCKQQSVLGEKNEELNSLKTQLNYFMLAVRMCFVPKLLNVTKRPKKIFKSWEVAESMDYWNISISAVSYKRECCSIGGWDRHLKRLECHFNVRENFEDVGKYLASVNHIFHFFYLFIYLFIILSDDLSTFHVARIYTRSMQVWGGVSFCSSCHATSLQGNSLQAATSRTFRHVRLREERQLERSWVFNYVFCGLSV